MSVSGFSATTGDGTGDSEDGSDDNRDKRNGEGGFSRAKKQRPHEDDEFVADVQADQTILAQTAVSGAVAASSDAAPHLGGGEVVFLRRPMHKPHIPMCRAELGQCIAPFQPPKTH